mmetsp:Transcript_46141/g.88044  ORF Transcript_46141/g.88044 Transcript_46141/m.88044 type:complete len:492 (+) Transcript_46141:167-1642(+)|eukprot:CAMPEP_0114247638 /NCGR_PEP_ID=MMETSP0058-20121206/13131_1 /TAXON_ID=36894 /ORGANISM="Pyramimonas parkeae, CCMP726" /LENGTH=491 /DNA_ID=CAMNT_0001360961 /DNA_START=167 /DNA_END=1642 /DNA_ORIENTATION=+
MGDKPADEPSSEDVVNEYLRRFDKRVEKKKSTNFLVNTFIVLLFGIAVAVVGAEFMKTRKWERHNKPSQVALHEYDEAVEVEAKAPAPRKAGPSEVLALQADSSLPTNVSGCSDASRPNLWDNHCMELMDGKIYKRGQDDDAPTAALMIPHGAAHGTHAATLLELPDSTLLYGWFSGQEGYAGVVIVLARLEPGADTWSAPVVVSAHEGRSNQNPVLFQDPSTSDIWIFHTSQAAMQGQGTSFIASVKSTDGGRTWSEPHEHKGFLDKGPFVKGKFLMAQTGHDWLVPMYYTPDGFANMATHYSVMMRTADHGETWEQSTMSSKGQFLAQPSVVRLPDSGNLLAFFRDRKGKWIYTSTSTDDGRTWPKEPTQTKLPNNNSGIQVIVLANGKLVLVFNNLQGIRRWPLSIAISEDQGKTWPYVRDLEYDLTHDMVEPKNPDNRYSYPSVIQTKDGNIHVGYTFRRKTMKHVVVNEAWIMAGGTHGVFKGDSK